MSPRHPTLPQLGFSLIELTVVIVVLGIVASVGATVLRDGLMGYLRGRELTSADWQGRLALERLTRDLRDVAAPNYSNISATSCGGSSFTYSDIGASQVSYTRSSTTLLRNGQPLADSVSSLNFSCFTSAVQATATLANVYYISVSMVVAAPNAASPNTIATYRSTVKPRSF